MAQALLVVFGLVLASAIFSTPENRERARAKMNSLRWPLWIMTALIVLSFWMGWPTDQL